MSRQVGRPGFQGQSVTLRLTNDAHQIMIQGAPLIAERFGKAPSNGAWIRGLITETMVSNVEDLVDTEILRTRSCSFAGHSTPHHVTVKLSDEHRIFLRRLECFTQSLDWGQEIGRNEVTLLLIDVKGPAYNAKLQARP